LPTPPIPKNLTLWLIVRGFSAYDDILGQSLESVAVGLHDGDGGKPGLAQIDVFHDPRLSGMGPADDPATSTVPQLRRWTVLGIIHEWSGFLFAQWLP
jgi:hypothetical protein